MAREDTSRAGLLCPANWKSPIGRAWISDSLSRCNLLVVKTAILPKIKRILRMLKQICPYSEQYYTGHKLNTRVKGNGSLIQKGMEGNMAAHVDKKSKTDGRGLQLSERDARLLLLVSTELLSLCARLAGKIDPAAAAMLTYVRDDIASEGEAELQ